MNLSNIIDEKIVNLELDVKNKEEALKIMSEMLFDSGYISSVEKFVQDIYLREEMGMTGIGGGIAIPHGKSDSVQKIGIAVAKLKTPIYWESIDEKPVDYIFLFAVSDDSQYAKNHLSLMAQFASKLGNDKVINELENITHFDELITVFS